MKPSTCPVGEAARRLDANPKGWRSYATRHDAIRAARVAVGPGCGKCDECTRELEPEPDESMLSVREAQRLRALGQDG